MRTVASAAAAVAAVLVMSSAAGGASERDALLRPGVAIGDVRLGMTLEQVRHALGRPAFVNRSVRLDFGRRYVEYAWNYSEWLVGFETQRGVLKAVRISTTSRRERTHDGVGIGTRVRAIVRRFPEAQCRTHSATIGGTWVFVRHRRGSLTLFKVAPLSDRPPYPQGAVELVVKKPVREFGVGRIGACAPDWRTW